MQVIDPHVHLWSLATGNYPWLEHPQPNLLGDYSPMACDHRAADLRREADEIEILKAVNIEADASDPVAETRWLEREASLPDSGGLPNALVVYVDLSRDDANAVLKKHLAMSNRVRGVRQVLNVHHDALFDYVGRHYMDEPAWQHNFALLARYGLSFDLQLYPSQMASAVQLARAHSDVQFILNHAGMCIDREQPGGFEAWHDGMQSLAACPNVAVKISGLAMLDHDWSVDSFRPLVRGTLDMFGVERCMFASNFPVDRLFGTYKQLWHAYLAIVADASDAELGALCRDNATRFYRL